MWRPVELEQARRHLPKSGSIDVRYTPPNADWAQAYALVAQAEALAVIADFMGRICAVAEEAQEEHRKMMSEPEQ